jgi:hypothetical protein
MTYHHFPHGLQGYPPGLSPIPNSAQAIVQVSAIDLSEVKVGASLSSTFFSGNDGNITLIYFN